MLQFRFETAGFIQVGQAAELKLETFNFTQYGLVGAVVKSISADAVVNEKTGANFVAVLSLNRNSLQVGDKELRLSPGMNLTAEIKTGRRRVIEFLTSGLWAEVGRSGRER